MPTECGTSPKQTARVTAGEPHAADRALGEARTLAREACESEKCDKGKCFYTETKVVGSTFYDLKTKKWVSDQTSSGKCSCMEEPTKPCKKEIEQKATVYASTLKAAAHQAREIARRYAQHACEIGECSRPKGVTEPNKCVYEETRIEGTTWKDDATGQYISAQTSIGKCRCEGVWA
jgi:hypothetical protein